MSGALISGLLLLVVGFYFFRGQAGRVGIAITLIAGATVGIFGTFAATALEVGTSIGDVVARLGGAAG